MLGVHDFDLSSGGTFKIALYTNSASFTAATTAYTTGNEVSGTGYTAGGENLTNVDPTTSGLRPLPISRTKHGVLPLLQLAAR